MITFVSCREEGETGTAGEQPASNTLYGYTAKEKVTAFFFMFFCRHPTWLRKPNVEFISQINYKNLKNNLLSVDKFHY